MIAASLAAAWLAAEITGASWLAAAVTVCTFAGAGLLVLGRRPRPQRRALAAGLILLGVWLAGALAMALTHPHSPMGLPAMLLAAAMLLVPVPLLYALTFPEEPR